MDYNLSDLKKKNVVNINDGKNMGKITDVIVSFPENTWESFIVGDKLKCLFSGDTYIVNMCCVDKIGEDTIFVRLSPNKKKEPPEGD